MRNHLLASPSSPVLPVPSSALPVTFFSPPRDFLPRSASARFRPRGLFYRVAMSRTRRFIPTSEWEDERQLLGLRGEQIAIAFLHLLRVVGGGAPLQAGPPRPRSGDPEREYGGLCGGEGPPLQQLWHGGRVGRPAERADYRPGGLRLAAPARGGRTMSTASTWWPSRRFLAVSQYRAVPHVLEACRPGPAAD